jgi:hypothetical protein
MKFSKPSRISKPVVLVAFLQTLCNPTGRDIAPVKADVAEFL